MFRHILGSTNVHQSRVPHIGYASVYLTTLAHSHDWVKPSASPSQQSSLVEDAVGNEKSDGGSSRTNL